MPGGYSQLEILNGLGWTLGAFILVIGIMIFVHELGHHLMAKYLGIKVNVFSLGFGPRLFGFEMGGTDYRVSLLPLGGYVKMAGEHYDDELRGTEDEFLSRPKKHRFAVAIAGPAMNIILAVLLLSLNYMVGIQIPVYLTEAPVVGHIRSDSPAMEGGFQLGDRILSIDGQSVETWEELNIAVATRANQTLRFTVERAGDTLEIPVTVAEDPSTGAGYIGLSPTVTNVVSAVEPESPADAAGIQQGDEIVEIRLNGQSATDLARILDLIQASEGRPIELTLKRDGTLVEKTVAPVEMDGRHRLGVVIGELEPQERRTERYGVFGALAKSIEKNYQLTQLTFRIVGQLITGTTSMRAMSGPIEIARVSGEAASHGLMTLIAFMAMVSLQLGIFNLFPIPILDGGVIMLLAIEGLMGRDLSMTVKERISQIGFLFLIVLMSIVIANDIAKNI